jgi:hypothetical protein
MDEGAFDQNFTWFEWGFVDPGDMKQEDGRTAAEVNGYGSVTPRPLEHWDEDHRWPT